MRRKDVIELINQSHREYRVAAVAVARLFDAATNDPIVLRAAFLEHNDIRRCKSTLEATYLTRIFSIFEANLRDVWELSFKRDTHPKMSDLIQGCASRQSVPDDILKHAHEVREYRNSIVHGGEALYVSIDDAKIRLCTFFGRMPPEW